MVAAMSGVWFVTQDRAAVNWSTALTAKGVDYTANVDIYRISRDSTPQAHERSQAWAKTGWRIPAIALTRAKQEQSPGPVPAAYPPPAKQQGQWPNVTAPAVKLDATAGTFSTRPNSDAKTGLAVRQHSAAQSANLFEVQNPDGAVLGGFDGGGVLAAISYNTKTTASPAGGAAALPATPAGYLRVRIDGVERWLPYY